MKFVNATAPSVDDHDQRRDIHLTGVVTEMTSGTSLMRRVRGTRALYAETRGVVQLEEAQIETYRPEGKLQGATLTDKALIFLADQPAPAPLNDRFTTVTVPASIVSPGRKGNMEFIGNFRHRTPSDNDSTDAMNLTTDQLVWDAEAKLFVCPSPYRMISAAPGKPPMVLMGKQFIATQDLRSFTMGGGSLTNNADRDAQQSLVPLGREIQQAAEVMADRYRPLPPPEPIAIPEEATGFRATNIVNRAEQIKTVAPAQ